MGYYELSRLLARVESLQSQYQKARKSKQDEAVLLELLTRLESALAQTERLQAHRVRSMQSTGLAEQEAARGGALPASPVTSLTGGFRILLSCGPAATILYIWVGGFWAWVLIDVLSDQYPAIRALSTVLVH